MAGEDFISVQLSAAGVKFAGEGGTVGIHNGRRDFVFKAGVPQQVLRAYEWSHILSPTMAGGEPMFEPAPAAGSAALPVTAQTTAPVAHEG